MHNINKFAYSVINLLSKGKFCIVLTLFIPVSVQLKIQLRINSGQFFINFNKQCYEE
jgi:hypothetical protein